MRCVNTVVRLTRIELLKEVQRSERAIIVIAKPVRFNMVGTSIKNNKPNTTAAIGSPPPAKIDTLPFSM